MTTGILHISSNTFYKRKASFFVTFVCIRQVRMSQRPPSRAPTCCFVLSHYFHLNNEVQIYIFSARQHMLSALFYRLTVLRSVRHTGGSVKTAEGRIIKFSP